jgi:hypothetical protein
LVITKSRGHHLASRSATYWTPSDGRLTPHLVWPNAAPTVRCRPFIGLNGWGRQRRHLPGLGLATISDDVSWRRRRKTGSTEPRPGLNWLKRWTGCGTTSMCPNRSGARLALSWGASKAIALAVGEGEGRRVEATFEDRPHGKLPGHRAGSESANTTRSRANTHCDPGRQFGPSAPGS